MYKKNDCVIYRQDVCVVKDIIKLRDEDYYALTPLNDDSLSLKVPVKSELLRLPLNKKDALDLIDRMKDIVTLDLNEKMLENEYQRLLSNCKHEDLIKIIKTTYLRNEKRHDEGKKISEKDDYYFKKAENLLYTELAISLGKTYEETKEFILSKFNQ